MRYTWIEEYLMKKRSVTKDLQKEWNWIRYQIGGKMFAAVLLDDNDQPYYINLKLEPMEGEALREKYDDIIPGYYSNKQHWNSVKTDGVVPDELLMDLLDRSYHLVLKGFSKKKQREILGLSCCGTDCTQCNYYGNMCEGCNETNGKVFHAPKNETCPIYKCSVGTHKFVNCSSCQKLPCEIWADTRDPELSEHEFDESVKERMNRMKE